ncbi:MAG: hypothetical protein ABI461_16610 [Polyangiaceae bacterium]
MDKAAALQAQLGELGSEREALRQQMATASGEEKARLQEELDAKDQAIQNLKDHPNTVATAVPVHTASHSTGSSGGTPKATATAKPCNCTPGDPLCSCL